MTMDELAARVELEVAEYRALLAVFIQATRADLGALRRAMSSGQTEAAARAAHSIKGAALNLELTEMGEAAARVEAECLAGRTDGPEQSISLLSSSLEALDALLRS